MSDVLIIISGYTPSYQEIGEISSRLIIEYCTKWQFDCRIRTDFDESREPSWSKIKFLLEDISNYQWLMWIDADACINRMDFDVRELCQKELNISKDIYSINCGVFIVRGSEYMADVLREVWITPGDGCWEQIAMRTVLDRNYKDLQANVHYIPQKLLNAPPNCNIAEREYDPAYSFICHAPAHHDRIGLMRGLGFANH